MGRRVSIHKTLSRFTKRGWVGECAQPSVHCKRGVAASSRESPKDIALKNILSHLYFLSKHDHVNISCSKTLNQSERSNSSLGSEPFPNGSKSATYDRSPKCPTHPFNCQLSISWSVCHNTGSGQKAEFKGKGKFPPSLLSNS